MNPRNIFVELKRRNVYKIAVAYVVIAWLVVQVATQVFPFFEIPNWAVRLVVLVAIIGFPIALLIAWASEVTPQGAKRTDDAVEAPKPRSGNVWIYVVRIGAAPGSENLSISSPNLSGAASTRSRCEPAQLRRIETLYLRSSTR